uniref:HAP1 N-terminal domain-containing protein n=1 Tax=Pseudonaja textilis TaxID=8673 RepID=A0A670ZUK9_PSETE
MCSERVEKITKTYHDIDAVTNLLEEKQHDLELAARIGKTLLKQNRSLSERNEFLEEQLELAKEEVRKKSILLFFKNTFGESSQELFESDSDSEISTLVTNIATETNQYEEQEQKLMLDCVEQFCNQQVLLISEELALKTEDSIRQQEEITQLLAQIVEQQQKCRAVSRGTEQIWPVLSAHGYFLLQDSLAAEIKSTMRKGMDSSGSSDFRRVFETVKAVNRAIKAKSGRATPLSLPPCSPKVASVACSHFSTPRNNRYGSDSPIMLEEKEHLASEDLNDTHSSVDATPGIPGHHVLEAAIQSLSARQKNHSTEHSFFEMERECKLKRLAWEAENFSGCLTPNESIASIGTNYSGSSGTSLSSYSFFPEKLQIVKPMEGYMARKVIKWGKTHLTNVGLSCGYKSKSICTTVLKVIL